MLNSSSLVGRLTAQPELRYTPSNRPVLSGTIAVGRDFKSQNGEYESDFINFVIWGQSAEYVATKAGKGALVSMSGRLQSRSYEDNTGRRVYVTELVAEKINVLSNPQKKEHKDETKEDYLGATEITDVDLPF